MTDETNPTAVTEEQPIDRTLPEGIVPEDPAAPPGDQVAADQVAAAEDELRPAVPYFPTEPIEPTPEATPEPESPAPVSLTEEVADPRDAQPHDPAAHTQR